MEKIYSIVVTFNGKKWIDKCLRSLVTSLLPVNIIVIDNCSNDGTVDYIIKKFPNVILIENKENLGFGQANNIGIKMAMKEGADAVFLLNQDAWIEPSTISVLADMIRKHQNFAVLSPVHLDGTGKKLDIGFRKYISGTTLIDDLLVRKSQLAELYEVSFVNAAAWLLSRTCLEKVGGFDPIFYHYGEDLDYLHRVIFHGFMVGVVPKCAICHDREGRSQVGVEKDLEANGQVTNSLVQMKNILVPDHAVIPSQRWLCIKYFADQFRSLIYQIIRKSWSDDFYINKKIYKQLRRKINLVHASREACKKTGPTFISL